MKDGMSALSCAMPVSAETLKGSDVNASFSASPICERIAISWSGEALPSRSGEKRGSDDATAENVAIAVPSRLLAPMEMMTISVLSSSPSAAEMSLCISAEV